MSRYIIRKDIFIKVPSLLLEAKKNNVRMCDLYEEGGERTVEIHLSENNVRINELTFKNQKEKLSVKEADPEKEVRDDPAQKLSPKNVSGRVHSVQVQMEETKHVLETYTRSTQTELEIQFHKETGQMMAKVTASEDGRVLREVPPKEILDLYARMSHGFGRLISEKA